MPATAAATTPEVALRRPESVPMVRLVVERLVEVAEVRSVLPVRVVDASVADEVALSMPIVEEPMSAPALKVMTVVVAFEGNG